MPSFDAFPLELRNIAHWCVYRLTPDPKNPSRIRKPPFQSKSPWTGCSSVDPSQWSTYEEALAALNNPANKLDGVGWFFTRPYFGVDLDHVRDEATGEVEPWALDFMAAYPTYWEFSPSGTGFHGVFNGVVPQVQDPKNPLLKKAAQVKTARVEVYGGERYFTVTARQVSELNEVVQYSKEDVAELYRKAETADPKNSKASTDKPAAQSQAQQGYSRLERFNLLSLGDWKELHASQSEADLEYMCFLAEAYKGDKQRTEAAFRKSKLFRDTDQKHAGYVQSTVEQAISRYNADPNKGKRKDSQAPALPLIVSRLDTFLMKEIPPREALMCFANGTPVFEKQSLSQIFAWRGSGKTMIAIKIAGALSKGGSFLNWKATRPVKTLYVEGEMPQGQMQTRFNALVGATENLFLITLDEQPNNFIPRLADPEGQKLIEDAAEAAGAEFIILDSISSLCGMATNEEESWIGFLNWLMRLRSKGYGVLMLHHAGKGGLQRGHSRSEDPLDLSIRLDRPGDYEMTDGLRVLLSFDKTRGIVLPEGTLEVRLQGDDFVYSRQQQTVKDQVLECAAKNPKWNGSRIARELDISQSLVSRYLKESGSQDSGATQEELGAGF